jgi:hypothetical protein
MKLKCRRTLRRKLINRQKEDQGAGKATRDHKKTKSVTVQHTGQKANQDEEEDRLRNSPHINDQQFLNTLGQCGDRAA